MSYADSIKKTMTNRSDKYHCQHCVFFRLEKIKRTVRTFIYISLYITTLFYVQPEKNIKNIRIDSDITARFTFNCFVH